MSGLRNITWDMKTLPLLFFFIAFQTAIAQNDCTILSTGFGYLNNKKMPGNFTESFPYTTKDISTGATTSQTFRGSLQNPFASNIFFVDLFNVEVIRQHHGINGGFGMNSDIGNRYSAYFKGGYSYVFPVFHALLIKPGVDLIYMWGYDESLGNIDNYNKIIDLLGHEVGAKFSTPGSRNSPPETYNSDQLAIDYRRAHLMACPKIVITNRPGKTLYCGIEAGWFISLIQTDTLRPEQMANDTNRDSNVVANVGINANGAVASFNQEKINKSPSIGGLYVAMKVGCYIKAKRKTRKV
jgi:hypothetical protein